MKVSNFVSPQLVAYQVVYSEFSQFHKKKAKKRINIVKVCWTAKSKVPINLCKGWQERDIYVNIFMSFEKWCKGKFQHQKDAPDRLNEPWWATTECSNVLLVFQSAGVPNWQAVHLKSGCHVLLRCLQRHKITTQLIGILFNSTAKGRLCSFLHKI